MEVSKEQETFIAEFDKLMQTDMGKKFLAIYDGYKTENENLKTALTKSEREKEIYKTAYDTVNGAIVCIAMMADEATATYCTNVIESVQNSILAETIELAPDEKWAVGPADPVIPLYSYVEKHAGEARWYGQTRATYTTIKGKIRHVVEVLPQGFQMIAVPNQLRVIPQEQVPEFINVNEGEISAGLKYVEADIFSDDKQIAHNASSPKQVEYARHEKREGIMRYIRFWKGRGK